MSLAYISNQQPERNYEPVERKYPIAFVTTGSVLNVEFIVRSLAQSTPQDFLVLDGSVLISAVCLVVWLAMHGEVTILCVHPDGYTCQHKLSQTSLRRAIALAQEQTK